MLRVSSLVRLAGLALLAFFFLHWVASFSSDPEPPSPYSHPEFAAAQGDLVGGGGGGGGWGEKLGLDHYADWEEGVRDTVGAGLGRLREGVGAITGLGGGAKRAKLGSLYELVATSNPSPGPAYFDARSALDKFRLSSTRVLGHGQADAPTQDDDESLSETRTRRHILVTGGFGSIGKTVVRDLLLSSRSTRSDSFSFGSSSSEDASWEEDVLVTVLDRVDRTSELNFLLQSAPYTKPGASDSSPRIKGTDPRTQAFSASERSVDKLRKSGKLRIIIGDVRDTKLVKTLLDPAGAAHTDVPAEQQAAALLNAKLGRPKAKGHMTATTIIPPVTGVIHLASYSPSACRVNPVDCRSVEEHGMDALLEAIRVGYPDIGPEQLNEADSARAKGPEVRREEKPWLVVPRRADRWDESLLAYNGNSSSLSLGAPEGALKMFSVKHPLHSLLMQLPSAFSIIGDPFAPRFDPVPHIVESALGNLPVTIYTSERQNEPFLSIDDASRAVVQGARMLDLASSKSYLRALAFVAEVQVVGPAPASGRTVSPLRELATLAIELVQSHSPFAEIKQERPAVATTSEPNFHISEVEHRKTATAALGFSPATPVQTALRAYVASLLRLQTNHLQSRISVACSSPPSMSVLEEGLLALSGCNVQLLTLIEGAYYTLGCSQGLEGEHYEPVDVVPAVPYKEGVRGVEITAERGLEGKVDIQMRCPVVSKDGKLVPGESEVVMWADTPKGGEFAEMSRPDSHAIAEWYTVDFVQRDARSFTLTLPPTEGVPEGEEPKRRLTFRDPNGEKRSLLFQPTGDEARALLWKFNPICCPASDRRKDVWDFFQEDPLLVSQVTFPSDDGRTTLSESTLATRRCHDLRAQHERITKLLTRVSREVPAKEMCHAQYADATTWTVKDAQTCAVDCSAPILCLATDDCKCTRDRCGDPRGAGPFPALAYTNKKSYPPAPEDPALTTPLPERVAQIPLEALLLPVAKTIVQLGDEHLPKAHVVEMPDTIDTHLNSPACTDIDKSPLPFMGDHYLIEALKTRSVSLEEADFVMIPYYQGCYYNYLQENTFKKLASTVAHAETVLASSPEITGDRLVIPFTHDYGSCTGWWPKLEDVLGHSPPSPMHQALAWQVNGDYNTHCIKVDRDVVVPAVTKHTKALFETFKTPEQVAPVNSRKHLAFFVGGVRGFGALVRTKIGCGRTGQDPAESKILYQQFSPGQRYLGTLNASKFCLLPRGIPAWTTRTFEAIYAGCIPAFIVDRNLFPFQDILDYSKFSVSIPEAEAHRVEEILEAYTPSQLAELQAHLVRVRDAFLFDDGREWERRGPLFFSLVSMAMRLPLKYPATGSCVAA